MPFMSEPKNPAPPVAIGTKQSGGNPSVKLAAPFWTLCCDGVGTARMYGEPEPLAHGVGTLAGI
jgi:hypothetical protein